MILNVKKAVYLKDYVLKVTFNNGETRIIDLESTIFNDPLPLFVPLREKDFFQQFTIKLNTICWKNDFDLAPEFLYEIGVPADEAA